MKNGFFFIYWQNERYFLIRKGISENENAIKNMMNSFQNYFFQIPIPKSFSNFMHAAISYIFKKLPVCACLRKFL